MLIGPVFSRELVTAPRRPRVFVSRSVYVAALLLLMCTAWMVLVGTQEVRSVGDMARFGGRIFQILAPLQLALAVFFAATFAASAVAHEKDRKTLILLLLTNLTNSELVLGKLLASLLQVLVMIASAAPLFAMIMIFGGVAVEQVARVFAVSLVSAIAAGSLGSTIALWREKTFQALALTALPIVLWLVGCEAIGHGVLGEKLGGWRAETVATALSPWRAVQAAARPISADDPALGFLGNAVNAYLLLGTLGTVLFNLVAIGMVRVWNPSREAYRRQEEPSGASIWGAEYDLQQEQAPEKATTSPQPAERPRQTVADLATAAIRRRAQAQQRSEAELAQRPRTRAVWDNPIIWREICTWCYGRKIVAIKLAYAVLVALAVGYIATSAKADGLSTGNLALALAPLFIVSLILVNAQAVTSMTSERDAKAIDLLLVSEITPKEFIFGKLGGVLYNAKEMIAAPLLISIYVWWMRGIGTENLVFVILGLTVLYAFVAVVGLHSGMAYENSRQAIGVSLGTVFFLFLGVATCMRIMVAFGGSFEVQFLPFSAMALGGGVGLFMALGSRNPSTAISIASVTCPFATFYAITSFLLNMPMAVFLSTALSYGFATAAMLIPAIFEFDVATGRTSGPED